MQAWRKYSCAAVLALAVWLPAYSADIAELFQQAQPLLLEEVRPSAVLPADLWPAPLPVPVLSSRRTGALAQYDAATRQIYFFTRALTAWQQTAPEVTPQALARCLAPLYIHELSHMRDEQAARSEGYAWPVTLEDEQVAAFWQLIFMQADPAAYEHCAPLLPPEAYRQEAACHAADKIQAYYAAQAHGTLPPPLDLAYIKELQQKGQIQFAGQVFRPKVRLLSLNKLFSAGGNWMQLRAGALRALPDSAAYTAVQQHRARREKEIQKICAK